MCRNLFLLSQNADLLITECSYAPGEKNTHWPHLNPEEAAHLAKQAKAKKLFLTHFDAARYETLGKRKEAQRAARKYFASASVVLDDMRVVL